MADDLTFLFRLGNDDLRSLGAALRSGRLNAPFRAASIQRFAPSVIWEDVARELQSLHEKGFDAVQIAVLAEALLKDRAERHRQEDTFDLVTTGPDGGASKRDTSVVVRELFANADESVLVAGYAVYQGQRVFEALADRMRDKPGLMVRMFLDVRRGPGDTSAATEVIRRFGQHFRERDWPADRPLPKLFYFSSSLDERPEQRAALHAKCVVVDGLKVFISSANFTEAAQKKNLEVGLIVRSKSLADQITRFFDGMVESAVLRNVL